MKENTTKKKIYENAQYVERKYLSPGVLLHS